MESSLIMAGFGGQGIISAGQILANALMTQGLEVTWLPAYGAEMRGGTVNCTIAFSNEEVASAYIECPNNLIAMNLPSFKKFEKDVQPNGRLIANSTLIDAKPARNDIKYEFLPMTQIANECGNIKVANIVSLGAFLSLVECVSKDNIIQVLQKTFEHKGKNILEVNLKALHCGYEVAKSVV